MAGQAMHTPIEPPPHATSAAAAGGAGGLRRGLLWAALLAGGPLLLAVLKLFPALDHIMLASPLAHLAISGAAALLGIVLALLVTSASIRLRDARVFLIGLGLLSIAALFLIHALSTPNALMPGRGAVTGWSSLLSLLAGGVLLGISGMELRPAINRWVMWRAVPALLVSLLLWFGAGLALLQPWAAVPASTVASASYGGDGAEHSHSAEDSAVAGTLDRARTLLTLFGIACYTFAAWRHSRLYRRSPSPAGLAITAGTALFGLALVSQWQAGEEYSLSFWLYHLQEFAGFGVISAAVLIGYQSGQTGEGLLESLFLGGTRARLQAGYASTLDALIDAIARGEQPSAAQRRELQARFGLAESQIRALEQAAGAVAQERRQRQELEHLNQQLRELQRDKEQLTQMVVHDLKNPLTALIGFLELMRLSTGRLDEHQRLLLESALRSGKNLAGLIGDLLDAARLEEGKLELDYGIVNPAELLHDCAGQMGAWLIQEEKTIRIEAADDLAPALADRRLLRRVLLNLISNAIKHTPAHTTVALRARSSPSHLILEVEDDGPGIAPERLERIFDRFGQRGSRAAGRQTSTGLGLSFCRLAVEAHGGAISVESTPGRGTLFQVTLPLRGHPRAERGATPDEAAAARAPV